MSEHLNCSVQRDQDPGHFAAHVKVMTDHIDVLECADIELIARLMCELGDKHQTTECELLRQVVLSLHSFAPQGTDGEHPIDYWQDKAREWFPEF